MSDAGDAARAELPLVSILIVNYNGARHLEPCLASVFDLDYPPDRFEVLVIDNGPTYELTDALRPRFPRVQWVTHTVNNYCRALNIGITLSRGEFIAFLNNDTQVDSHWLTELVSAMQHDRRIGASGSKVLLMDGSVNSAGHAPLPNFYWVDRGSDECDRGQYDRPQELESVSGCAMLIRRQALEEIGEVDEDFVMYMEDVDVAYRLRQRGWTLHYVPSSIVRHVRHGSPAQRTPEEWTERNRLLFIAKHQPDRLGHALIGQGFLSYPKQPQPGALLQLMPEVLDTLVKHHGVERALPVVRELLEQLQKVQQAEWQTVAQETARLERDLTARIAATRIERDEATKALQETADALCASMQARDRVAAELSRIYASQTYRYFARPLWRTLEMVKRVGRRRSRQDVVRGQRQEEARVTAGPASAGREIPVACTIISKNYLSHARVLARSFLEHHPGGRFFVLLADRLDGYFNPMDEPFTLVQLEDLAIPALKPMCFRYTIVELNTAVKPFFLSYLFTAFDVQKVVFLDPDILVLAPLSDVYTLLDRSWMVLTPHLTSPLEDDGCKPSELTILQAGTHNLGFLALRRSEVTQQFLHWWQQRLARQCEMAPERGMHVDQKWIDLVPSFFDGVFILRDPGYNVAYWNLSQRPVVIRDGAVFAAGSPCRFIHFSGVELERLESVSKHQTRLRLSRLGDAAVLFGRYRELLEAAGHRDITRWPYAFGSFDNGAPIPDSARSCFRSVRDADGRFGDPFQTQGRSSFFQWLNTPVDRETSPDRLITRLWEHIHRQRPDLQRTFPDMRGRDRRAFLRWVETTGRFEHRVDTHLIPQLRCRIGRRPLDGWGWLRVGYTAGVRPLEPWLRPLMRRLAGTSPRTWNALRTIRYRLTCPPLSPAVIAPAAPIRQATTPGVNVAGYLQSEKGMGESVRAAIRALEAAAVPHAVTTIADPWSENPHPAASSNGQRYDVNLIHVNADQMPAVLERIGLSVAVGRYTIGYWTWELSKFPEHWRGSFAYVNEVWVPSSFVKEALAPVSPVPVVRIPHAIRLPDAQFDVGRGRQPDTRRVTFLFLFDFMSYWQRKNPFGVIDAFKEAFPKDAHAELIIKTSHAAFAAKTFHALQQAAVGAKIRVIDGVWAQPAVERLLGQCDCLVSLHRSEGFGLSLAEAMARGKPVIATNYSGNLDFMTPENSLLVDYRLMELEEDYGPYQRGNHWADPNVEHAAELMRWVAEHPGEAAAIGARAAQTIRQSLGPDAVGAMVRARLQQVVSGSREAGMGSTAPVAAMAAL